MANIFDFTPEQLRSMGMNAPASGAVPQGSGTPLPPNAGPVRPFGASIPSWLKSSARFLGTRVAAPLAIGAQGLGAARAIAETTSGATPENRPERARKILAGLDIVSPTLESIYRTLSGTVDPDAPNPILGPAGQAFATRRPGAIPPAQPAFVAPPIVSEVLPQTHSVLNPEEILRRNFAPESGTGAISLSGGPAEAIDTRGRFGAVPIGGFSPAPLPGENIYRERAGVRGIGGIGGVGNTELVGPPQNLNNVGNIAGNFMGALLNLKQISGDNAQRAAQAKLDIERRRAAAAELSAEGTYLRGIGALSRESFTVPEGGMPLKPGEPVTRLNRTTGQLELVRPTQPITMAQAIASAKKNGTYKSDAQVRADMAKLPGYRLID